LLSIVGVFEDGVTWFLLSFRNLSDMRKCFTIRKPSFGFALLIMFCIDWIDEILAGAIGLRPASAMVGGSPKVDQSRDVVLELNNQFSDTSSSSSSTCSDLSIPSCSSSSLYSGYTTSRIGSDTESASSTPRTTPSKNIPRPGKPGSASKGSQRSYSMKSSHQNVPHFELQEDPEFWNDHNVQV